METLAISAQIETSVQICSIENNLEASSMTVKNDNLSSENVDSNCIGEISSDQLTDAEMSVNKNESFLSEKSLQSNEEVDLEDGEILTDEDESDEVKIIKEEINEGATKKDDVKKEDTQGEKKVDKKDKYRDKDDKSRDKEDKSRDKEDKSRDKEDKSRDKEDKSRDKEDKSRDKDEKSRDKDRERGRRESGKRKEKDEKRSKKNRERNLEESLKRDEKKKRELEEKLRKLEAQMASDTDDEEMGIYATGGSPLRKKRRRFEPGESDGTRSRSSSKSPTSLRKNGKRKHEPSRERSGKRNKRDREKSRERRRQERRKERAQEKQKAVEKELEKKERDEKGDPIEICFDFLSGNCNKSARDCKYSHESDPTRKFELCKFYLFDRCAKREKCLYLHKVFPCKYYHTGTRCMDTAETCKFSHDPLNDQTRTVLLKHLETAPKEILGDFPRMSKESAAHVVYTTEAKHKGWPNPSPPIKALMDTPVPNPNLEPSPHRDQEAAEVGYAPEELLKQQINELQMQAQLYQQQQMEAEQKLEKLKAVSGIGVGNDGQSPLSSQLKSCQNNINNPAKFNTNTNASYEASLPKKFSPFRVKSVKEKSKPTRWENTFQEIPSDEQMDDTEENDYFDNMKEAKFSKVQENQPVEDEDSRGGGTPLPDEQQDFPESKTVLESESKQDKNPEKRNVVEEFINDEKSEVESLPNLPKTQQALFKRIAQKQKEVLHTQIVDKNDNNNDTLMKEENWYSTDEEDEKPKYLNWNIMNQEEIISPKTNTNFDLDFKSKSITLPKELTNVLSAISKVKPETNANESLSSPEIVQVSRDPRRKRANVIPTPVPAPDPWILERNEKPAAQINRDTRTSRDPRMKAGAPLSEKERDKRILELDINSVFGDLELPPLSSPKESTFGRRKSGGSPPTSNAELDLFGLPFKPVPNHGPCIEIDASVGSNEPIVYQLQAIIVKKPDYSHIKINVNDPSMALDPRLRIYMKQPGLGIIDAGPLPGRSTSTRIDPRLSRQNSFPRDNSAAKLQTVPRGSPTDEFPSDFRPYPDPRVGNPSGTGKFGLLGKGPNMGFGLLGPAPNASHRPRMASFDDRNRGEDGPSFACSRSFPSNSPDWNGPEWRRDDEPLSGDFAPGQQDEKPFRRPVVPSHSADGGIRDRLNSRDPRRQRI